MIFVTAGTNEQSFDRLIRVARDLPGDEDLFVQYGSSPEPHGRGRWVDFLSWDQMVDAMTEARFVVAHAGAGSILLAHRCGKRPVVMARRGELGEAVDDHQLILARRLDGLGLVTLVDDLEELTGAIARAPANLDHEPGTAGLSTELRATLMRVTRSVAA